MSDAMRMFALFGVGVILVLIVGLYSILTTKNLLRVLIGMELLTKAVTLLLIAAGYGCGQIALAQALVITLIVVEVAVIVVAVALVLCIHREHQSIDASLLKEIKG
jgi:NADH-quinone oxidoreductase subunit K